MQYNTRRKEKRTSPPANRPSSPPLYRLVVFDMDGVLVDVESSWVYVHHHYGTNHDGGMEAYNRGEIDDHEFMHRDIEIWKSKKNPIHYTDIERIVATIPIMKGARETIKTLRENGVEVAIVSAGLMPLAKRLGKELGIEHLYANDLATDEEGYLIGKGVLGVELKNKGEPIDVLARKLGVERKSIAAVGNSYIDIPMFEKSGLGIAFNPSDEKIKQAAEVVIEKKDLREIIPHVLSQHKTKSTPDAT